MYTIIMLFLLYYTDISSWLWTNSEPSPFPPSHAYTHPLLHVITKKGCICYDVFNKEAQPCIYKLKGFIDMHNAWWIKHIQFI